MSLLTSFANMYDSKLTLILLILSFIVIIIACIISSVVTHRVNNCTNRNCKIF